MVITSECSCSKPISSSKLTCNAYRETFSFQPEYLEHRKHVHPALVPLCKNDIKGKSKFSENNCWFIMKKSGNVTHENNEEIFSIMEKMTERISLLGQNKYQKRTTLENFKN